MSNANKLTLAIVTLRKLDFSKMKASDVEAIKLCLKVLEAIRIFHPGEEDIPVTGVAATIKAISQLAKDNRL